jgi:hypothetical protein
MRTNLLTQEQFDATYGPTMTNVTFTAEPTVDIWPYVGLLVSEGTVLGLVHENTLVEKVYRNPDQQIDHILLPTAAQNVFVVVLVDVRAGNVYGHFVLDLNKKY